MKLIIIDGTDNVGKTTFIKNLSNYLDTQKINFSVIKFFGPQSKDKMSILEQMQQFSKSIIITNNKIKNNKIVIWDRVFYNELIYGVLYRNLQEKDLQWIFILEDILIETIGMENIYYYQFYDDAKNLLHRDDGKSLHKCDIGNINSELFKFEELFQKIKLKNKFKYRFDEIIKKSFLENMVSFIFSKNI